MEHTITATPLAWHRITLKEGERENQSRISRQNPNPASKSRLSPR